MATPLTDAQLFAVRAKIGDSEPPDDFDLADNYARLGTLTAVVVEIIEKRIATLLQKGPLIYSVDSGEVAENFSNNLKGWQEMLAQVKAEGINGEGPVMGRVKVGNFGRRWGR